MRSGVGVFVVFLLAACSDEPRMMLPDGCYGDWELLVTSGGIGGVVENPDEGPRIRVTITRENELVTRTPDGKVSTRSFAVRKGKTIFSAGEGWLITYAGESMEISVELYPDGTLSLSENVYDGFTRSYRRPGVGE